MAKKKAPKYDFAKLQGDLQRQFQNLDPKDPSLWPALPRTLLCLLIAGGVATFLWFFKLSEYEAELTTERGTEQTLRADYQKKLMETVSGYVETNGFGELARRYASNLANGRFQQRALARQKPALRLDRTLRHLIIFRGEFGHEQIGAPACRAVHKVIVDLLFGIALA